MLSQCAATATAQDPLRYQDLTEGHATNEICFWMCVTSCVIPGGLGVAGRFQGFDSLEKAKL